MTFAILLFQSVHFGVFLVHSQCRVISTTTNARTLPSPPKETHNCQQSLPNPQPSPWAPGTCSLSLWICLSWTLSTNGVITVWSSRPASCIQDNPSKRYPCCRVDRSDPGWGLASSSAQGQRSVVGVFRLTPLQGHLGFGSVQLLLVPLWVSTLRDARLLGSHTGGSAAVDLQQWW